MKAKQLLRDIAVIRHAQSEYNIASTKYLQQNKIVNLSWDEICQINDFNLDVNFNKKFIDCDLSDVGAVQSYQLKEKYEAQTFDYDLVLVSPLRRALRTCRYIFHYYPIKKIIVPELTQAFRYACDISLDIEQKRQQFKQLDFSLIEKNDNYWVIKTQPVETQQLILKRIKDKKLQTYQQIQNQLLFMMYEGKIYESDYHLRLRTRRVKQILQDYRKQYNKIIIISHHYLIQGLLAKGYRNNHQPIIATQDEVPNAKPLQTSLHQLLDVI